VRRQVLRFSRVTTKDTGWPARTPDTGSMFYQRLEASRKLASCSDALANFTQQAAHDALSPECRPIKVWLEPALQLSPETSPAFCSSACGRRFLAGVRAASEACAAVWLAGPRDYAGTDAYTLEVRAELTARLLHAEDMRLRAALGCAFNLAGAACHKVEETLPYTLAECPLYTPRSLAAGSLEFVLPPFSLPATTCSGCASPCGSSCMAALRALPPTAHCCLETMRAATEAWWDRVVGRADAVRVDLGRYRCLFLDGCSTAAASHEFRRPAVACPGAGPRALACASERCGGDPFWVPPCCVNLECANGGSKSFPGACWCDCPPPHVGADCSRIEAHTRFTLTLSGAPRASFDEAAFTSVVAALVGRPASRVEMAQLTEAPAPARRGLLGLLGLLPKWGARRAGGAIFAGVRLLADDETEALWFAGEVPGLITQSKFRARTRALNLTMALDALSKPSPFDPFGRVLCDHLVAPCSVYVEKDMVLTAPSGRAADDGMNLAAIVAAAVAATVALVVCCCFAALGFATEWNPRMMSRFIKNPVHTLLMSSDPRNTNSTSRRRRGSEEAPDAVLDSNTAGPLRERPSFGFRFEKREWNQRPRAQSYISPSAGAFPFGGVPEGAPGDTGRLKRTLFLSPTKEERASRRSSDASAVQVPLKPKDSQKFSRDGARDVGRTRVAVRSPGVSSPAVSISPQDMTISAQLVEPKYAARYDSRQTRMNSVTSAPADNIPLTDNTLRLHQIDLSLGRRHTISSGQAALDSRSPMERTPAQRGAGASLLSLAALAREELARDDRLSAASLLGAASPPRQAARALQSHGSFLLSSPQGPGGDTPPPRNLSFGPPLSRSPLVDPPGPIAAPAGPVVASLAPTGRIVPGGFAPGVHPGASPNGAP
jgi:hypothetical protein